MRTSMAPTSTKNMKNVLAKESLHLCSCHNMIESTRYANNSIIPFSLAYPMLVCKHLINHFRAHI